MTTTIGSGLGGFVAAVAQPTYGAAFVTPTRTLTFKSAKITHRQHPVQGGPYLRNGQIFDQGSARLLTWTDAMFTLSGDVVNTGHALLLATALGSSAALTLISGTAYGLGGATGTSAGAPDKLNGGTSGCCMDMQIASPTADATQHQFNYHSCMVTKAEWVFDRTGLVTYSYDIDAQQVETTAGLITPTEPASPIPFSFANASSLFKVGTFGSEAAVDGVRKCTITLERKLSTERIYLGNANKDIPVTNGIADIKVALECDYTSAAKPALFDLQLAGTPISVVCGSVMNAIGASGKNDTFQLNPTNCFVDTGGEASPDGPDILKNTISLSGTIDNNGDPALGALLYTADTTF